MKPKRIPWLNVQNYQDFDLKDKHMRIVNVKKQDFRTNEEREEGAWPDYKTMVVLKYGVNTLNWVPNSANTHILNQVFGEEEWKGKSASFELKTYEAQGKPGLSVVVVPDSVDAYTDIEQMPEEVSG